MLLVLLVRHTVETQTTTKLRDLHLCNILHALVRHKDWHCCYSHNNWYILAVHYRLYSEYSYLLSPPRPSSCNASVPVSIHYSPVMSSSSSSSSASSFTYTQFILDNSYSSISSFTYNTNIIHVVLILVLALPK